MHRNNTVLNFFVRRGTLALAGNGTRIFPIETYIHLIQNSLIPASSKNATLGIDEGDQ